MTVTPGSSVETKARDTFERSSGWSDAFGRLREADQKNALIWEEYRDTPYISSFMSSALPGQSTELSDSYQFDHEWDPQGESFGAPDAATGIRYHWHWEPQADPVEDQFVKLSGLWVWTRVGVATPALAGWTAFEKTFTVSPGDVYKPRIDSIVDIPIPTWAHESSVLLIYTIRDLTDLEDDYSTAKTYGTGYANVMVKWLDCHYWKSKRGTKTEY